jgi:hypothetical protein
VNNTEEAVFAISGSTNVVVRNLTASEIAMGVLVFKNSEGKILESKFSHCGKAVLVKSKSNLDIEDSVFEYLNSTSMNLGKNGAAILSQDSNLNVLSSNFTYN